MGAQQRRAQVAGRVVGGIQAVLARLGQARRQDEGRRRRADRVDPQRPEAAGAVDRGQALVVARRQPLGDQRLDRACGRLDGRLGRAAAQVQGRRQGERQSQRGEARRTQAVAARPGVSVAPGPGVRPGEGCRRQPRSPAVALAFAPAELALLAVSVALVFWSAVEAEVLAALLFALFGWYELLGLLLEDWSDVVWAIATEPTNSAAPAPRIIIFLFMGISVVPEWTAPQPGDTDLCSPPNIR